MSAADQGQATRPTRNTTTSLGSVEALMAEGLSPVTIADRLGLATVSVRTLCKKIDPSYCGSRTDEVPFGLSDHSMRLRSHLGRVLYDLTESRNLSNTEASSLTGLNRNELIFAVQRPWSHDWKISQIERLCNAAGIYFPDCLHYGIYKPRYVKGFYVTDHFPASPSEIDSELNN